MYFFKTTIFFLCLIPLTSWGFHLNDHETITKQALIEFSRCFPGILNSQDKDILVISNLEEDLNLIRKDLVYSHYYNPTKNLDMFRFDSMVRVHRIQESLTGQWNEQFPIRQANLIRIAHAIHHIQDMAVPAHVIPISHGLSDGFEKFKVHQFIESGISCAELENQSSNDDLERLIFDTATETIQSVNSIQIPITSRDQNGSHQILVGGTAYWQTSQNNRFGQYGFLENHFGDTSFHVDDITYQAPLEFYEKFKKNQIAFATRNTLKALYWSIFKRHAFDFLNSQQLVNSLTQVKVRPSN